MHNFDSGHVYVYTCIDTCIAVWKWEDVNVSSYLLQVCSWKQPKVIISFTGSTEEKVQGINLRCWAKQKSV